MAKKIGAISYGSPFNGFLGDQKVLLSARIAEGKKSRRILWRLLCETAAIAAAIRIAGFLTGNRFRHQMDSDALPFLGLLITNWSCLFFKRPAVCSSPARLKGWSLKGFCWNVKGFDGESSLETFEIQSLSVGTVGISNLERLSTRQKFDHRKFKQKGSIIKP